jgi:long-chain acyl-CoA synthetase
VTGREPATSAVNVADVVREAAEGHPSKAALIFQGRMYSYEELDDIVDTTGAALAALGVRQGDRVALIAGNVPEFVSCFYGTLRIGAVISPLNVMLTLEELAPILADSGAKVAISDLTLLPGLLSIREELPDLQTIVAIGGPPAPSGTVSLEEALATDVDMPEVEVEPDDLAVLAYTAGTTAEPKGAMLTHRNLVANLEQMANVPDLAERPDDVVLLALPLFHIYALNVILGLTARTAATAVMVERFDPEETLELIERHRVSVLFGAPPMFAAWIDALRKRVERGHSKRDVSSVRLAVSGAAALPEAVFEGFRDRFGITIWEGYGLTEAAPAVTSNAVGPQAKPESVGLPLPGVEVRLVDETGEDVEDDDPGEIWVRGPNVFAGYWNRPQETEAIFRDGWLRTGDVAYRDDDGYLHIVDRKKDLIIVSGFNVYPKEVEEAIELHPSVAEAAVVGVPDDRTGEAVQAWVVPGEGRSLDPEEISEFLQTRLARFKQPKEIRVVEELPHHVTGKVLRRALREIDQEEAAGAEMEAQEHAAGVAPAPHEAVGPEEEPAG